MIRFAPAPIAMQYRSQSGVKLSCKLARRLLCICGKAWAMRRPKWPPPGGSRVRSRAQVVRDGHMAKATLTISSRNYSSWSLRGWLLTKFSGLDFEEIGVAPDDASARAEILLLSPTILVPCLRHEGATIWDTLAIAEYLSEAMPQANLLPRERVQRAHCRSICGEIHSGFATLRASLPVNLKHHFPGFKVWTRAQADIDRVWAIWTECLAK